MTTTHLTARHRSMLRAVAAGRGELVATFLLVDGRWCDFTATNDLVTNGLIRAAWPGPPGTATPAVLTSEGMETLAALAA